MVREGVTNVLRHSNALRCVITTRIEAGVLRLEVINDGVPTSPGTAAGGSGIGNLSARIQAVAGTLTTGWDGRGRFTLVAEVPVLAQPTQAVLGAGSCRFPAHLANGTSLTWGSPKVLTDLANSSGRPVRSGINRPARRR